MLVRCIRRAGALGRWQHERGTRALHAFAPVAHGGHSSEFRDQPTVRMTFVLKDGTEKAVEGKAGQSVLSVAHEHDVDLEGACESSLACSTCHVVVDDEFYERLKEPCEEEEDMLDLAWGLTPTSRLGCQVILSPELDGLRVTLPKATRNMYVDGHVPKPH